ncbi:MAG: hypothetical protein QM736_17435 [Vicinamibacterales bacterium]
MKLIADRFVADERGATTDLATGEHVVLIITSAGGTADQAAWAERCAWFSTVMHPCIAPLIDYGTMGDVHRFEAWGADTGWRGTKEPASLAVSSARAFISGHHRLAGAAPGAIATRHGHAVVVPNAASGVLTTDAARESCAVGTAVSALGLVDASDSRLAPLADLLSASSSSERPLAVMVWTPDDATRVRAVRTLARAARLGGYVPVDVRQNRSLGSIDSRGTNAGVVGRRCG